VSWFDPGVMVVSERLSKELVVFGRSEHGVSNLTCQYQAEMVGNRYA
jgi:hypothetical protein